MLRRLMLAGLAGFVVGTWPAMAASERGTFGSAGELLKGLPPPPGHYDAVMCVTVGDARPAAGR